MMLVICDRDPELAVDYLVEHTNKNFVFKQLIEFAQLICSAGISNIYKKMPQGKELQEWIKKNPYWCYNYFNKLLKYCRFNVKLQEKTINNLSSIATDLYYFKTFHKKDIETGVFRYDKRYISQYQTNSELSIRNVIKEYKRYLEWKFKKENNNG